MPRNSAAIGLRAHSGWAVLVAVADETPILRRRIDMIESAAFRANQPYHAAAEMPLSQAETFLKRTADGCVKRAAAAIAEALAALAADGYQVRRATILQASGKPLPDLPKILAAHPLIHTAEGVFFREVLQRACRDVGLTVATVKEREIPAAVVAHFAAKSKVLGPPWTMDEKLAAAAAHWSPSSRAAWSL
jgi:hypothetical protein